MTVRSAMPTGVRTLIDRVLVQVEPGDVEALVDVTEGPGSGMVVSGKGAIHAIEYACGRGYRQPFLADRQLYKGKARCATTRSFDPDWISRQRRLELPVILPDAGYVAEANIVGLRHVLIESAKIDGAVALLAVANWWLYGPGLRLLLSEVSENPTPLALVIEHGADPFSARRILAGVLDLLATGVPVIPLRCDISALGLLAHGAVATAFGSQSSLRHLYPVRNGGGGGGGKRPESAVWPAGVALHYSDLLHDVVSASHQTRAGDAAARCAMVIASIGSAPPCSEKSARTIPRVSSSCALLLPPRRQIRGLDCGGAGRGRPKLSMNR
ncbi:MAG: hypothetical protein ACRDSR_18960 [Pseudonocardiaceae bacterium]